MKPNSFAWYANPERLPTDDRYATWWRQKFLCSVWFEHDGIYREVESIIHGFMDDYGDFSPMVGWPKLD